MKKINLILSFILLNTIVFPAYAVDDGETKFIIQQDVGIKTKNPSATLHLNGTGLFEDGIVTFSNTSPVTFNSLALVNSNLQIPTGAAPGFVLVSNATGVASWADPTTVTSAGDNLGDHLATQTLNMGNNGITNVDKIGIRTPNPTADLEIFSNNLNNGGIQVRTNVLATEYPILRGPGNAIGASSHDSFRINLNWQYLGSNLDYLVIDKTDGNNLNPDGGIVFTNTGSDGIREASLAIRGDGYIGVGTNTQTAKFDIGGGIRNLIDGIDDLLVKDDVEVDGSVYIQDDLILTKNPGAGKILISDRNGKAMWTVPAMVQTNGDNMGNHTANRNLDMASHDITSVKNITATSFNGGTFNGTFKGDGSGLTNVKSSVFKIIANTILNNGSQASYANNFLIGSPSMDDSGNSSHDAKFFFNKAKAAFRAGKVEGNEWNDINVGQNSIAFGKNTRASGENSFAVGNGSVATQLSSIALGSNSRAIGTYGVAIGFNTLANDDFAVALGTSTEARGKRSTAFGHFSKATGFLSTAFGNGTLASGITSIAFGQEAQATNVNAIAIGKNVRSSGNQAFTIGSGNSNLDMLTNSINNSLAIGFATNQPTVFVGPASGGSTDGRVGIGTNTPQDLLDVDGRLRTREFRMPTGAANDFVLTSDGIGVGTWKSLAAIGGTGDNLGDHKATQTLDMDNQDIKDVKYLNAANILSHNNTPGAFGTRVYAQVPAAAGYADFVTVSRQTPASPLLVKWAVGSTGDTRDISDGGANTFYIHQKTNKNDVAVNGYRLAIDDTGLVGIGLHNPKAKLDVGGGVRDYIDGVDDILVKDDIEVDGTVFTGGLRIPTGAANNLVLTSDASGNATWKSLASLPGAGDDLGNHTATTHLNMSTRNITNVGTIIAANFGGSGAGITNINAANISTGVLHIDRIPNIPASKLASLSLDDLTDAITNSARNNVFVGENSGNATTTTQRSTALGKDALKTITTGTNNTAVGYLSMHGLTTGFGNTAIGTRAGAGLMAAAEGNTNIGARTMSSFNSALGLGNPQANGKYNTNIGELAGGGLYDGDNNVNIGAGAGKYMSNASNNVAIGYGAMANTDQAGAQNNIAIGYEAGQNMAGGRENIVIGSFADVQTGYNNYSGRNNIILGNGIKNSFGTNNSVNIGNLITGFMPTASNASGSVNINGSLMAEKIKLTTGAGAGRVLTSDAAGNATWQSASGGGADNLGNHTATTNLNMSNQNITSAGTINAISFSGSGTGITNINAVNISTGVLDIARIPSIPSSKITSTGAGAGRVLTSDAAGNATWQSASGGGADNLGNHTATTNLNMVNRDINNVKKIIATNFEGNSFGKDALKSNTTSGINNIAMGDRALTKNTTGNTNLAIGDLTLFENVTGSGNFAIGYSALRNSTATGSNFALGHFALRENTTGIHNVAVGSSALMDNTTGIHNLAVGGRTMMGNKTGSYNAAVGYGAFESNISGDTNTVLGQDAMRKSVASSSNTALGFRALHEFKGNASDGGNIAIGRDVLHFLETGSGNIAIGSSGTMKNGSGNIYIGAGSNTNENYMLRIGNLITGNFTGAPSVNINGSLEADRIKLTIGAGTGRVLTSDAAGNATWQNVSGGADNLGNHRATQTLNMNNQDIKRAGDINGEALYATKVFARNTASGAFGSRVYADIPREDGFSEFVTSSIGADNSSLEKWSVGSTGNDRPTSNGHPNAFYIFQWRDRNNNRVDQYRLHINNAGNVSIGGLNASHKLEVLGSAAKTGGGSWSNISDARLKDVHGHYEYGLKEIMNLNTVRFSYKKDNALSLPSNTKEIGFIAQEVQKVIPDAVTQEEGGYLDFNIHPVNVAMVNAIQELKAEKDAEIKDLKEQVSLLKKLYCLDHASTELCK